MVKRNALVSGGALVLGLVLTGLLIVGSVGAPSLTIDRTGVLMGIRNAHAATVLPSRIAPAMLKKIISDRQELALIDPREEGAFYENHLLLAVNIPLSRLEICVGDLVPRKTTRIVLSDEGEGLSERAALRFKELGYSNVTILEGGVGSWKAAGYEVFSGLNVPTKAFGEWVEHHYKLPSITPEELDAKLRAKENMIILDSRTPEEYQRFTLPGSISAPSAELVYRFWELPITPDMLVVVNCAGRTRSILGAQSLINAGVKNRVVAFRGGTMAWELAGFTTEKNANRYAPAPSEKALREAHRAAAHVAKRFGVRTIDAKKLAQFEGERNQRTLYLFDVRTKEEYLKGHRPKSIHAPGGQLVQAIDTYAATRNSRIVLIDEQKVRAQMTASWLVQAGWPDVFVLANPFAGITLERGERKIAIPGLDQIRLPIVKPTELQQWMKSGEATVIDFATSLNYRNGHIPGAWFAVRSRLGECLMKIPASGRFVVTGDDLSLVTLAGADLARLSNKPVNLLEGLNRGWRSADHPLNKGMENLATKANDRWNRPTEIEDKVKADEAKRAYLRWEEALPEQVSRDGDLRFGAPSH